MPSRLSGRDRRALLHRLHLGQGLRARLRGDHRHQPLQLHLRAGLRRALRARLPAHRQRRTGPNSQSQTIRDGRARGGLPAARGAGHEKRERRHRGRGAGGAGRRTRSLHRRLLRTRVRDDRPSRGHDDLGDPRLPAPARHHRRGCRPAHAALSRARSAPQHRAGPRHRHGGAQAAP